MKTIYYTPHPLLQRYIYKYWSWECRDSCGLPKALPGVVAELIFHYESPFVFVHSQTGKRFSTEPGFVAGVRKASYDLQSKGKTGFISVRFREGAFHHFCGIPQKDIVGRFLSLHDLWGTKGIELGRRVADCQTNQARVAIIDSYLMRFLKMHSSNDLQMEYSIRHICRNGDLNSLSKRLNISYRHFYRKFSEFAGMSPKQFQKISNFDSVMRTLTLSGNTNYLDKALKAGYFDQSHFIKDFKKYVNETPSVFFTEKNFMSHFYNTGAIH